MKLTKLVLVAGVFFSLAASAQSTTPPTAPTEATQPAGEHHHHHHKLHKCVHAALKAKGITWPGKDASVEQKQQFHEAKKAAFLQCKSEMQNEPVKN